MKVIKLVFFLLLVSLTNLSTYCQVPSLLVKLISKEGNIVARVTSPTMFVDVYDVAFINTIKQLPNAKINGPSFRIAQNNIPDNVNKIIEDQKKYVLAHEGSFDRKNRISIDQANERMLNTSLLESAGSGKVKKLSHDQFVNGKLNLLSTSTNISINPLVNVNKLEIYISIPRNKYEFKNIFKSTNNRQINQLAEMHASLANGNENIKLPTSANTFKKMLSASVADKPVVLIGHNENGKFYFPNGSYQKIGDLDSLAIIHNRIFVYLSCNAKEYTSNPATDDFLTYKSGISIANHLNKRFESTGNSDQEQTRKTIENILNEFKNKENLKFKIVVLSIGTGLGLGYGLYMVEKRNL